jgi:flagellin
MGRIGAILSGTEFRLLERLAEANAAAALNSLHLATQKRVNAPGDDPSTFVTLSRLQSRLNLVQGTMANATAASSMIGQAQTAIDAVQTQLEAIRTELLKDEDRSLTPSQRAASQAAIDDAVAEIDLLADSLIDGRRLLDGSADFHLSGFSPSQLRDLRVYSIPSGSTATISGTVTHAATQSVLVYTGDGGSPAHPAADAVITIAGKRGSAAVTVTTSQTLAQLAEAINDVSHKTGVTAEAAGNELTLTSVDYGSDAAISVTAVSGTFNTTETQAATDAEATINGWAATGDGSRFLRSESGFLYEIEFAAGFEGDFGAVSVSGDALTFALSESPSRRSTVAIPGLAAVQLGGISGRLDQIASGGPYSGLDANTSRALRIVDEALGQIEAVKGSVDGFSNAAIASASELLSALQTELEDAIVQTDGYNQEEEETLLAKNEQLADNAIAGLAILNQQRSALVTMLQQIAGLI